MERAHRQSWGQHRVAQLKRAGAAIVSTLRAGLTPASNRPTSQALHAIASNLRAGEDASNAKRTGFWRLGRTGIAGDVYVALLRIARFDATARIMEREAVEALIRGARGRILQVLATAELGRSARGLIDIAFLAQSPEDALAQMQRLSQAFDRPVQGLGDETHLLTVAIGLALSGPDEEVAETIEHAEHALALSDTSSVRCVLWNAELLAEAAARQALAQDLRAALADKALSVVYQPKLRLRDNIVDSVEALVRWEHPTRGSVSPDEFVTLAEETGDIGELTRFVLLRALEDQATLQKAGAELAFSVNLSPALVADQPFCAWVVDACRGSAGEIGLEITETSIFTHPERALANLNAFVSHGLSVSIDDYGSGLSSLAYLRQLPATELKIDKMFILGLTSSHRDPLLVRSTIDLAHALEMEVTAEGVDHPQTLALLRVMGCDRAQGFHIAAALSLAELQSFLSDPARHAIESGRPLLSIGRP